MKHPRKAGWKYGTGRSDLWKAIPSAEVLTCTVRISCTLEIVLPAAARSTAFIFRYWVNTDTLVLSYTFCFYRQRYALNLGFIDKRREIVLVRMKMSYIR